MKECPKCEILNSEDRRFCMICNADLDMAVNKSRPKKVYKELDKDVLINFDYVQDMPQKKGNLAK